MKRFTVLTGILVLGSAILMVFTLGSAAEAAGPVFVPPAALNTNAATDSGPDFRPQVTTDGSGNWVAVWESNENLSGSIGTDGDILLSLGVDGSVGGLEGTVAALDPDDFGSSDGGRQNAMLTRIRGIEDDIANGDIDQAIRKLQNLRRWVDGCGPAPDVNDSIVDCAEQVRVRALIDALIASLSP